MKPRVPSTSTQVARAVVLGTALGTVLFLGSGCASDEPAPKRSPPPSPRATSPDPDAGAAPAAPRPIVIKGSKSSDAPAAKDTSPEEQERIARLNASAQASQGRHEGGTPVASSKSNAPAAPRGHVRGSAEWGDNLAAARERAHSERKLVLLDFTGSDWCPWCQKLKHEVFDTPEFQEWASNNAVLLEVDFPRRKPQTDELKAQNRDLQAQLEVKGYPKIVFQDEKGKVYGSMGYMEGGPDVGLKKAQAIVDSFDKT